MDKETKQLNIFLLAITGIGFVAALFTPAYESQAVQIDTAQMEVTQEIYRAIYTVSLTCDIKDEIYTALDDEKITYSEATHISTMCEGGLLDQATQPFERGMLKEELKYIKNGGTSM